MDIRHETGSYTTPATVQGERNDCAVRALMVAACVDYQTAYDACAAAGRKPRQGMHTIGLHKAIRALAPQSVAVPAARATVAQFVRSNPRGHFILFVRWHFVAVCDGILHDWYWDSKTPRIRRRILYCWKLV